MIIHDRVRIRALIDALLCQRCWHARGGCTCMSADPDRSAAACRERHNQAVRRATESDRAAEEEWG